jgi:glutathione S-transferase
MSIPGKILAVLNVLAAGLFVFLAAADWGKRQSWTYGVYRFQLAIDGLPLDAEARGADGVPLVKNLTDKTFQDVFKPVGGISGTAPEDKTQVGEVKRVQAAVRKDIEAAPTVEAKREKLSNILVNLQRTEGDREAMYQQIMKTNVDQLMAPEGPLDQAFNQAIAAKNAEGQERDPEERRLAIAHLLCNISPPPSLFNMSESTEWKERAQVVVGLKTFVTEVNHQAAAFQAMFLQVGHALEKDRDYFEKESRRILGELQVLNQNLADRKSEFHKQQQVADGLMAQNQNRTTELAELRNKVNTTQQSAQAALLELDRYQKRLFEAQKNLRNRLQKNRDLEREIGDLEGVK